MRLCRFEIVPHGRPLVIAECGINHQGNPHIAMTMIEAAADAGADIVKTQLHMVDKEMLTNGPTAGYIKGDFADVLRKTSLPMECYEDLKDCAEANGMMFLCTPFSIEAADFLDELGVQAFKIGSGECSNGPLVQHIASKGKPVLLSTGMTTMNQIKITLDAVGTNVRNFILMNCTSVYPCPDSEIRLRRITGLYRRFGLPVGQSDHGVGIVTALAAVAYKAVVIEKHFTLDKTAWGPDQAASIEPNELKALVEGVRRIWHASGYYDELAVGEPEVAAMANESIVTIKPIQTGEILGDNNLWVLRPGTGIPAAKLYEYFGRRARVDIPARVLLREEWLA